MTTSLIRILNLLQTTVLSRIPTRTTTQIATRIVDVTLNVTVTKVSATVVFVISSLNLRPS